MQNVLKVWCRKKERKKEVKTCKNHPYGPIRLYYLHIVINIHPPRSVNVWPGMQVASSCAPRVKLCTVWAPAYLLVTGSVTPPPPHEWCGSAEVYSEPGASPFEWTAPVSLGVASAGTFEMSPDHRSPGSGRRRSLTCGCWCAWQGGEERGQVAPPFVPYASP